MPELLIALVVFPIGAICGVVATYAVWVQRADPYKWGGIFAAIVGHSGRFGYSASTGFTSVPLVSATVAMMVRTLQDEFQGERTGFWNGVALTAFWLTLAGFVLMFSILLFMRPRFLVPPYLRGKPGWVLGAWRDHREKRRLRSEAKGARTP